MRPRFTKGSLIFYSLFCLGALFPVVGYLVSGGSGENASHGYSARGAIFVLVLAFVGFCPNLIIVLKGLGKDGFERFFTFECALWLMSISPILIGLPLYLMLNIIPLVKDPVRFVYLAVCLFYVPGLLLSFATFPRAELRNTIITRLDELPREVLSDVLITLKYVRANTSYAAKRFLKDNLTHLCAVSLSILMISLSLTAISAPDSGVLRVLGGVLLFFGFTGISIYLISANLDLCFYSGFAYKLREPVSVKSHFWILYVVSIIASVVLFLLRLQGQVGFTSVPIMLRDSLSAAVWYVQFPCFIGILINVGFSPMLVVVLTKTVHRTLRFWKWIQLESVRRVTIAWRKPIPNAEPLQMFVHTLLEIVSAVLWALVVLLPSSILDFPIYWIPFGGIPLVMYVFLLCEYKGIEVLGVRIGPSLLHKLWTILLILSVIRQLFTPITSLLLRGIGIPLSMVLGFTLGFVASYEIAADRVRLVENSRAIADAGNRQ